MAELNIVEKVIALEGVDLMANLTSEQLARIGAIAREVRFPPGRVILEAGKPLDALYVVVEGAVALSRDGEVLATARHNEVLGAWALFEENDPMPLPRKPRKIRGCSESAAKTFTTCSPITTEITSAIFSTLVRRFRKLVEQ